MLLRYCRSYIEDHSNVLRYTSKVVTENDPLKYSGKYGSEAN